jgi:hypothetical protein
MSFMVVIPVTSARRTFTEPVTDCPRCWARYKRDPLTGSRRSGDRREAGRDAWVVRAPAIGLPPPAWSGGQAGWSVSLPPSKLTRQAVVATLLHGCRQVDAGATTPPPLSECRRSRRRRTDHPTNLPGAAFAEAPPSELLRGCGKPPSPGLAATSGACRFRGGARSGDDERLNAVVHKHGPLVACPAVEVVRVVGWRQPARSRRPARHWHRRCARARAFSRRDACALWPGQLVRRVRGMPACLRTEAGTPSSRKAV